MTTEGSFHALADIQVKMHHGKNSHVHEGKMSVSYANVDSSWKAKIWNENERYFKWDPRRVNTAGNSINLRLTNQYR